MPFDHNNWSGIDLTVIKDSADFYSSCLYKKNKHENYILKLQANILVCDFLCSRKIIYKTILVYARIMQSISDKMR